MTYSIRTFEDPEAERRRLQHQALAQFAQESRYYLEVGLPQLAAGLQLLDIGSGTGALAAKFLGQGFDVTCVDPEKSSLQRLPKELTKRYEAHGEALPFGDSTFDVVFSRLTLQHSPSPDRFVAEAKRVLKPKGTLLFVDTDHDAWVVHPTIPAFDEVRSKWRERARERGAHPCIGRRLPQLLGPNAKTRVLSLNSSQLGEFTTAQMLFSPFFSALGRAVPIPTLRDWAGAPGAFATAPLIIVGCTDA